MSFASGKGGDLYVGGFAIHDLLRQFSYTNSADVHDVTTFKSDSRKFIGGLRNGVLSAEGIVDSGNEGQVRALLSATGKVWTAFPAPSAPGDRGAGLLATAIEYSLSTPVDDIVGFSLSVQSDVGIEPIALIYYALETASGQSGIVDQGMATAQGGSGYLQVPLLAGTSPTLDVEIRQSNDNFAVDDTLLAAFSQVTAGGIGQRIEFSGTVKRYVRARWTLGGTSPQTAFLVGLHRN